MAEDGIEKILADFGQKLTLVENRAKDVVTRFEVLCREA